MLKEMQEFKVKVTAAANETFDTFRDSVHDDLVLAACCAIWVAEKGTRKFKLLV